MHRSVPSCFVPFLPTVALGCVRCVPCNSSLLPWLAPGVCHRGDLQRTCPPVAPWVTSSSTATSSTPMGAAPGERGPPAGPVPTHSSPPLTPSSHLQHRGSSTVLTAWGPTLSCGYSQKLRSAWTPAEPVGPGLCAQCPRGQWCRALGHMTSGANTSDGPHLFYQFMDLTHCPRMVRGDCGRLGAQRTRAKSIPFFLFLSPARIF